MNTGIQQASNYPIQSTNDTLDSIVVAVADKNNDLCTAINEFENSTSSRKKRDVDFNATTDIALDQATFIQIIQTNG